MKLFRVLALTFALAVSAPVFAQPGVVQIGPGGATAEAPKYVWATRDASARRWSDAETPVSGDVKTNDRLQVVYRNEGWVRVRLPKSPKFGWLPADAVVDTQPEGAEGASIGGEMSEDLQRQLQEQLQRLQMNPSGEGQ